MSIYFSVVITTPYITHSYNLGNVKATYYCPSDWYTSQMSLYDLSFSDVQDPNNIIYVGFQSQAQASGTSGGASGIYAMIDPQCGSPYTTSQGYTHIDCNSDSVISLGSAPDSESNTWANLDNDISYNKVPAKIGLYSQCGIDRGEYVKMNNAKVVLYEQVECTENSHCPSEAPYCGSDYKCHSQKVSAPSYKNEGPSKIPVIDKNSKLAELNIVRDAVSFVNDIIYGFLARLFA